MPADQRRAPTRRRGARPHYRARRLLVLALVLVAGGGAVLALTAATGKLTTATAPAAVALDPTAFAPGACVAYSPTAGDNHRTVFLDAGHGGIDPGGVGTTGSGQAVRESDVNLAVELDAAAILRARGFRVVVSRTADTTVVRLTPADTDGNLLSLQGSHDDVVARDTCANLAGADALVGIYMDAGASAQDAGSVTLYDRARPFAPANQRLATLVQADVLAAMNAQGWQVPDDGTLPDGGFGSSVGDATSGGLAAAAAGYDHLLLIGPAAAGYFTGPSLMPGAVIEPLYLTDPFEGTIAADPADQRIIARGVAAAVTTFLTPQKTAAPTTVPTN